MKCPKCSHQNEDGALFCNKCGYKFEERKDWNSILILAYCCSLLFWGITYMILPVVFNGIFNFSFHTTNIIYAICGIISALLTFVLPLGIRTTWMKIVAFIVVAIAAILNIGSSITRMTMTFTPNF